MPSERPGRPAAADRRAGAGGIRRAEWPALLLVTGLALGLRLWSIGFGLPAVYRPDEDVVVGRAMGILRGVLDPHFADWPHLYFYVSAAWIWLAQRIGLATDAPGAYLAVRVLDALLGTLTVAVVYQFGRRAYGRVAGVAGAAALTVSFLHVRDSHFATIDVPLTLAIMLSLYAAYRLAEDGRLRHALTSALGVGIATGTKYSGALALAGVAAAQELRYAPLRLRSLPPLALRGLFIAAIALLVLLLSSPFLLLDPALTRHGLTYIFRHLAAPTTAEIGWSRLARLALWNGLDGPLFVLALAGVVVAAVRREAADWVLLTFLLAYYGLIGAGFSVFVRYADPLLPPLALLAGRALVVLARTLAPWVRPVVTLAVGLLIALVPPVLHDITFDQLLGRTDTRTLAARWLDAELPPGTRIATPYFAGPFHDQSMADEAHHTHGATTPYVASFLQNRLTTRFSVHELTDAELQGSVDTLRRDGVDYVVLATNKPDAGCAPPTPLERSLRALAPPLISFAPTRTGCPASVFDQIDAYYVPLNGYSGWDRPGPLITVYRIP
jgi:hypothetical protein